MKNIKIATLNVRGLCNHIKRRKLFYWLKELNYDVILLQETYCQKSFVKSFNDSWQGTVVHAVTDSPHSRGVCILFSSKLNTEVVNYHASSDGRTLLCNVKIQGTILSLVNIYAPNAEYGRKDFLVFIQ